MTVTAIISLLRIIIDAPHINTWSDANLIMLIASEYRDLIDAITERNADYYVKSAPIVTITNNKFTAIPSDCTLIKKIVDSSGNTVAFTHDSQFNHTDIATTPLRFDVKGQNIWWNPTPDAIYTYTAFYHYQPVDLSSGSNVPELPTGLHDILAYAVAINTRIAKEDKIDEYLMKYNKKLSRLLHRVSIPQTNNPRRVLHAYDSSEA